MQKWLFPLFTLFVLMGNSLVSHAESTDEKKLGNLNKGIFIVASDHLNYTSLNKTVIYIIQHDEAGSSGVIVNRPTNLTINEAFPDIHASTISNNTLYFGGPLHTQYLFMLTQTQFTHGLFAINQGVYFGTGDEIKVRLQSETTPDKMRTYAGFISWGPGQLEQDILDGNWVMAPGDSESLFSKNTEDLWETLYNRWAGSWI